MNSAVLPLLGLPTSATRAGAATRSSALSVLWLDEDRGRLAPAQRDRRFVDPHRDRIAAEQPLMQNFDPRRLRQNPARSAAARARRRRGRGRRPRREPPEFFQPFRLQQSPSGTDSRGSHPEMRGPFTSLSQPIATRFQLQVSDRIAGIARGPAVRGPATVRASRRFRPERNTILHCIDKIDVAASAASLQRNSSLKLLATGRRSARHQRARNWKTNSYLPPSPKTVRP